MVKVRKSKYDLIDVAYLKIPKSMYEQLKQHNEQWSELARDIIFDFLKKGVSEHDCQLSTMQETDA